MEESPHKYIDKIVGMPKEPEKQQEWQKKWHGAVTDHIETIGAEEIEGFEIQKTERDAEILAITEKAVDALMLKYGRLKQVVIPSENIHILKDGGTEEFTKGRLAGGAASIVQNSLIADRISSDSEFAATLFHEMVHLKSYNALQIIDEKEVAVYRSGIAVVSRDGTQKYFQDIEEAVVTHLTEVFRESVLKDSPYFKGEIVNTKESERQRERGKLDQLVDEVFEKNKAAFSNRDEVFELFIDAQINGNILKISRLVEGTYGKEALKSLDVKKIVDLKEEIEQLNDQSESEYEDDDETYDTFSSFPRQNSGGGSLPSSSAPKQPNLFRTSAPDSAPRKKKRKSFFGKIGELWSNIMNGKRKKF